MNFFKTHFSFWDKITAEQKELFCKYTTIVKYEKNANISGLKNECTGVIFVKNGQIRSYIMSDEGREITLYRLYPGDICMLSASCVIKSITFDVFVDAEENSEVYVINPQIFSKISDENVYVENFALNIAVSRFSEVMWAMQQILFMSFDRRLAIFLLDEISKTSSDILPMTHEQIAKYMGSAREVVSRMIKYFSSEGIVEAQRGGIKIIDKNKLRKLAL